jgi:hypothetical protein
MAWIESHQELANHPKLRKLARLLGLCRAHAIGMLHLLWWWAMDYAQDGDVSRFDPLDVALAADWDGEPALLLDALRSSGFLDEDGRLHHWDDYAGRLIERRRKDAARKQQARAASVQRPSAGHPPDGARNTTTTTPNRTEPNHTAPSAEGPEKAIKKANGATPCRFADAVADKFDLYVSNFREVNPQLDRAWLRATIAGIEAGGCELPPERMHAALDNAFSVVADAFSRSNGIAHPPAFAASRIAQAVQAEAAR